MSDADLVDSYAKAALSLAVDAWTGPLAGLTATLQVSPAAGGDERAARDAVERALPEAPEDVRKFAYTLASKGQLELLPEILTSLRRLAEGGAAVETALVTSTTELSATNRGKLTGIIRRRFGRQLEVRFKTDPELLGGVIVRVGDRVIDGSISTRLGKLANALAGQH